MSRLKSRQRGAAPIPQHEPDERPVRYLEAADDGSERVVYRASGLGSCERAIVATAQPHPRAPHPEWFQKVLDEGTICEPLISAMWDEVTEIPTTGQQAVVELDLGMMHGRQVIVRGHIDGQAGVDTVAREYKKIRQSGWEDFKRKGVEVLPQYPWQTSVIMHATGWTLEFVGGLLDPECKEGEYKIKDVYPHFLESPPIPLKGITKRIKRLESLIHVGMDATEVNCQLMFPCPYWKPWPEGLHEEKGEEEFEVFDDGETGKLAIDIVAELVPLKNQKKELEDHVKKLENGLRAALKQLGGNAQSADKLRIGRWRLARRRHDVEAHHVKKSSRDYFTDFKEIKE